MNSISDDDLSLGWELLPKLDFDIQKSWRLLIKPGTSTRIVFRMNANYENAVIIYRYNGPISISGPVAVRGNYGRSLDDYYIDTSEETGDVEYYLTGWHKNSPPDDSKPWIQSCIKFKGILSPRLEKLFGFEDTRNWQFDAVTVKVYSSIHTHETKGEK
uniref:Uncharacterized protein n=1 Tax=Bacillus phage PHBA67-T TaxID=3233536 RepID=A0AAU7YPG5_9CAUD